MTPSQDFLPLLLLLLPAEGGKHVHGSWRLLGVPAPPWLCIPTSTHAMIIPDFYSSSSAVPQILSASQKSSCLTSPLLSPHVCVPKYPPSFPWLSLVYPAMAFGWAGGRAGTRPSAQQLMPSQSLEHPCFSLSGNSHTFAQNLSDVGITVSIVSPAVSLPNSVQQVQEC